MLPGCRTRHAAVAIPFFNFNFNNNNNNSLDCYDHNQEEETSFIISQHHHQQHHHHHQHHCMSPTTTTASQTTQQKDEQTQVEFDCELQPKKSISLCFEQQDSSGMPMSPAEAEPKKKLIRSSKSSSFRRLRSGRDTGAAAKSQPQPSILMTTSLPPLKPHSSQLSTDEGDLITSEETATTGGGDNSSTTTDGGEHQHQQKTLENNQNLLNQKLISVDISAEKTAVRMRPRRPLLTRQRPYSDFYAAGHHRNPHHHQEEFESVNEQLTEKQLKRRSVQESMSYYSLCFPTPPARVAKHRENGDKQQTIEEKDDSKKETVNVSSETLINPQQQQQSSSEVVMRDNSSLKRRMRKANLQLRDLQQNSFSSQQSQPPPPTAFINPAYYSLSLDISPDFEKELPPPPSCHDSMASPINDSDDNDDDEDDDDDEQLYSFESSEHDPNPHNFQQPQRPQRTTTATTTDLDLLEDYLEPEEMLEIVTSTDSLDGDDVSPTLKMRTIAKYHQTPAHKMSSSSSSQQQPLITSNSSNLPPQPPQRKHRTHRAPSVSHSSSGYQSLVLVDGMATTASFDLTSNPSLSNSSSFADHHHHQSAVTTITSSSSSSSASTNQHSSNLDNLARSITLNLRSRTAAQQQQQQQQRNSFELQELRSPLEQEVVVSRKDGQNTSTNSGHHHRSRSLERSNSSSVEMSGKHHRNAHHHHHNKPHWQPNITEVIREVIVPRSPALINQTESRSTYDSFRNKKSNNSSNSRPLVSAFVGRGRHGVDNNGVHESWQLCMYVFGGRDGSTGGSVLLNKQPITIWKLYI